MLFVVEGPDKAGKTTLVKELQAHLEGEVEVLHSGPIQRHPLDEYVRRVDCALQEYDHVVCDRLHIGEQIYGPLLRGESRMPNYVEDWIDLYLRSRGAVLIWVDTPMTVIYNRIRSEGDELIDVDQVKQIYLDYIAHFQQRGQRAVSLNPLRRSAYGSLLMEAAEHRDLESSVLASHDSYVGGRHVRHLFVGHERSSLAQRRGLPGAFAPYGWSSGAFLMQALDRFGETYCYGLVNAGEDPDLEHLVHVLEYPNLVALGIEASSILAEHGLDHATVPHPQWVKRFHSMRGRQYGELLGRAALTGDDATPKELAAC